MILLKFVSGFLRGNALTTGHRQGHDSKIFCHRIEIPPIKTRLPSVIADSQSETVNVLGHSTFEMLFAYTIGHACMGSVELRSWAIRVADRWVAVMAASPMVHAWPQGGGRRSNAVELSGDMRECCTCGAADAFWRFASVGFRRVAVGATVPTILILAPGSWLRGAGQSGGTSWRCAGRWVTIAAAALVFTRGCTNTARLRMVTLFTSRAGDDHVQMPLFQPVLHDLFRILTANRSWPSWSMRQVRRATAMRRTSPTGTGGGDRGAEAADPRRRRRSR